MPRCAKKKLKRLTAPAHWMLAKTDGVYAIHPRPGPHKAKECLPTGVLLKNRLKYALTGREVTAICKKRLVKVDGKVRTDTGYPAGLMDVIQLDKTHEQFRLLYDAKGRFVAHKITPQEAEYKLCRVNKFSIGRRGVAEVVTHDGRTIRFVHPELRVHDTLKLNLKTGEVESYYKFKRGSIAMVTSGGNVGRVGVIQDVEKQQAQAHIVKLRDAKGSGFATRITNVFVIGDLENPLITLPKAQGVRGTILDGLEQAA